MMIRYQRIGRTNDPAFRIVLLEKARAARTGRIVEQLGTYNPKTKALRLEEIRIKEWMGKGAQPTDTVRNLLITKGVMEGKKADVFPSSARKAARIAVEKAEAEAKAATQAAEVAVAAPAEAPVAEVITEESVPVEEASAAPEIAVETETPAT